MSSTIPTAPHRKALIGSASNFWLHSSRTGFDLTHPSDDSPPSPGRKITINTTTTPITIDPAKSALLIIDMQNFFLSPSLGRDTNSPGHKACTQLTEHAIPAARQAGIRIVWVNWGLSDEEATNMPAGIKRSFGFQCTVAHDGGVVAPSSSSDSTSIAVDKHGVPPSGASAYYKGVGAPLGTITLDNGTQVDAGRLLVRHSWNTALHPPLQSVYDAGRALSDPAKPDVWIHKNRMSALWGADTPLQRFLEEECIATLLFAGVNTDQCVGGTLTDAFSKGYDCVLLSDGCGTSSPGFAQECWEYNVAHTFGFCASCADLARGVAQMDG